MSADASEAGMPPVVWVSARPIASALDSATWLETTRELRVRGWPITLVGEGPLASTVFRVSQYSACKSPGYMAWVTASFT